jgi:hypothetical protein
MHCVPGASAVTHLKDLGRFGYDQGPLSVHSLLDIPDVRFYSTVILLWRQRFEGVRREAPQDMDKFVHGEVAQSTGREAGRRRWWGLSMMLRNVEAPRRQMAGAK